MKSRRLIVEHGPLNLGGIRQHRFVRDALAGIARFGNGQHIVTETGHSRTTA